MRIRIRTVMTVVAVVFLVDVSGAPTSGSMYPSGGSRYPSGGSRYPSGGSKAIWSKRAYDYLSKYGRNIST